MNDSSEKDYYAILEVSEDADDAAVQEAYRRRAQQYHPDKVQHLGPEFRALAEKRMREINVAYDILRDPEKRRAYDAQRRQAPPYPQEAPEQHVPPAAEVRPEEADESSPRREASAPKGQAARGRRWVMMAGVFVVTLVLAGIAFWTQEQGEPPPSDVAGNLQRAREFFQNGDLEEAILLLQQVTEVRPDLLEAWNLRWQAELSLGLYSDGAKSLERAIERNPTDPALRVEHARARFMRGELEKVRAELLWLQQNGETAIVVRLLEAFHTQNPERAEQLVKGK